MKKKTYKRLKCFLKKTHTYKRTNPNPTQPNYTFVSWID